MARRFSAAARTRALALALAWFLVAVLAACGSPAPPGVDPFLQGVEPFGGPFPSSARIVTLDEMKALAQHEGFRWVSLAEWERQAAAAAARYAADLAAAAAWVAEEPDMAWLLEVPEAGDDLYYLPTGEPVLLIETEEGFVTEVLLQRHADVVAEALEARERLSDPVELRRAYGFGWAAAPAEVRTGLPSPQSLGSSGVQALRDALAALEGALAGNEAAQLAAERAMFLAAHGLPADTEGWLLPSSLDDARPPGYTSNPLHEIGSADLYDRTFTTEDLIYGLQTMVNVRSSPCAYHDNGLQANYWYPQKYYQTTVKAQGKRGSCVAFALTSALESNVAIRENRWVNLSEQRLYYDIKAVWQPRDFGDGAFTYQAAVAHAESSGLGYESTWQYNPSWYRGEGSSYTSSCGYGLTSFTIGVGRGLPYDQACSDTTHQAEIVCVASAGVCGYFPEPGSGASGPTYRLRSPTKLYGSGPLLPVETMRALLRDGHPIVVSLRVDTRFKFPSQGYVTPTTGPTKGYHAVHVVGFVPAAAILHDPTASANRKERAAASGGGFFVIKNSWGCSGDGGYWYVPVAWARQQFIDVTVFDRGPAPNYGLLPPTIDIVAPENNASFHVSPLLTVTFQAEVSDPKDPSCCDVRWTSSVDGHLGHGTTLTVDFGGAEPGARSITATATNAAGLTASYVMQIVLTTSAPNVTITSPPKEPDPLIQTRLYAGLSYLFAAEEFSPLNAPQPCSAYTWTSTRAGEGPWSGCSPTINFDTTGGRLIILRVTNPQGQQGQDSIRIAVDELPPDGPPVVTILSPASGREYFVGDEAILRFDALDPAGGKPTMNDVVWRIQQPGGPVKTITVQSRTIFDAPGRPGRPTYHFVPSDYVTPSCFPTFNPANAATLRLSYTNALGLTGFADAKLFVSLPPDPCVN